ncbi:kyphoscoliosis peptidase-like isoform X2 [Engystomops pustulosus]|uniref:kyphoscoliosis peptidase-like isoform X2 n=1 Tax=Engystomops pustulosus TaxID=76066 RepID=UPI003AFB6A2E
MGSEREENPGPAPAVYKESSPTQYRAPRDTGTASPDLSCGWFSIGLAVEMGRGNIIWTENAQHEKTPLKIPLLKNTNSNNNKKCIKGAPQCNPEDLIQGTRNIKVSSKCKSLDLQNGNVCEIHKRNQSNVHLSGRTSRLMDTVQSPGTFHVTSLQDKAKTSGGSKKEVFTFWSTKIEVQETPKVKTSPTKTSGDHRSVTRQETPISTSTEKTKTGDHSQATRPFKRKKKQELLSLTDFTLIDEHVRSVSSEMGSGIVSVPEIVQTITARSRSDIEKLRAIWIWLCHNISYDVEGFLGNSEKLYKTEDVVEKKRGVCAGYAGLCRDMCSEAGIRCREITGCSRGADSCDSAGFHRTKSNHMWNVVELEGAWYHLDACWGAGTVDLQQKIFIPRHEDFFFLTDPEDFIETHWPDDPSWQLLESTVSFEDFEEKIFKTSEFFRLRLFIISPTVFHLTTDGEVKVSLGCCDLREYSYKIYKLLDNSRVLVEKNFGVLTIQEASMTLRVFPPSHGLYELMIFARPLDAGYAYKWVCSYQIDCPQPKTSLKLPENPYHFWGLNHKAKDYGVISYNSGEDLISSEKSSLKVTFKTCRPLVATFQLAHPELSEAFSKKCLASQIEDNQLGCCLLLPFHGYYRLSLFVKDFGMENFQNAANIFIKCNNPINHNELFPPNLSVHCGPGTNSRLHGLTSPSHTSPIITTTTGRCNITFHTLWDLNFYPVLEGGKVVSGLSSLDRHCFLTHLDHKISLTVHLPESGHYKLSIFTRRQVMEEAQDFYHACDYVIDCYSTQRLLPFPKVYSAWGHGCALLQPRVGLLPVESWEIFRVKIPGVCKVLVIGPVKTELQLTKNRIWEGKVFTGTAGSVLKIAVKVSPDSSTMDIVMSFKTQQDGLDTSG